MKAKFLVLLILLLSLTAVIAVGASGDIAGQYYHTDIVTTLNGVEIDSINIGGETLISAEDMRYYGFDVTWYAQERELRIKSKQHATNGTPPKVTRTTSKPGTVRGNYYETDIVTYLDGKEITSYNVGGRTYVHAEEMRRFGFDAIWDGIERKLTVTSPYFGDYVYSIPMIQGKPQNAEGNGCFAIEYTNDAIAFRGDAEYFTSTLSSNGTSYTVLLQFYQNDGLFFSSKLLTTLRNYCKYSVNAASEIKLTINGVTSNDITVSEGGGNGHCDFYITSKDIPKFSSTKIKEISFSVGNVEGFDKQSYSAPALPGDKAKEAFVSIKANPLDWLDSHYEVDEYIILNVCESKSLGVITNRMYVVNTSTGSISGDILDQIRNIDGFDQEVLRIYAMKVGAIKNNLFFSCSSSTMNGDFYVELDSATVRQISVKNK